MMKLSPDEVFGTHSLGPLSLRIRLDPDLPDADVGGINQFAMECSLIGPGNDQNPANRVRDFDLTGIVSFVQYCEV